MSTFYDYTRFFQRFRIIAGATLIGIPYVVAAQDCDRVGLNTPTFHRVIRERFSAFSVHHNEDGARPAYATGIGFLGLQFLFPISFTPTN